MNSVHPDVASHIVDVHCHPTDSPIEPSSLKNLPINICAMSTRRNDQALVADLARKSPRVIPCFGYHPWFSHFISLKPAASKEEHYRLLLLPSDSSQDHVSAFDRLLPLLPDPTPLSEILDDLRQNLESFPSAMLGEVGIDKSFRVAYDYFAERRELTPFSIPFEHQLTFLEAQIELAVSLQRNISLHSVKCPSQTQDLINRLAKKHGAAWLRISVDLHSCGVSPETLRSIQKQHPNVFLSLSKVINGRSDNHKALIASCPPDRLLAESDFHKLEGSPGLTWEIIQTIAEIKSWPIETEWHQDLPDSEWGVVRHLEENWKRFAGGNHVAVSKPPRKADRRRKEAWLSNEGNTP